MQVQRLLGGIAGNRQAAFGEHDLGGCFHELLGRANRACRIVWQGTPDALQLGADPRWVAETGDGAQVYDWSSGTNVPKGIEGPGTFSRVGNDLSDAH